MNILQNEESVNNSSGLLEVVNEDDVVIGLETRENIHKNGLLHREIHIWFVTPKGEIIFQHRSRNKDTYPDKLDATVGGHVEPNMSYEETTTKECEEETGVNVDSSKLILLKKFWKRSCDKVTGTINNTIRSQYAYLYEGLIEDLRIEKENSEGFEAWDIDSLPNLSEEDKNRFIPLILEKDMLEMFQEAKRKILK